MLREKEKFREYVEKLIALFSGNMPYETFAHGEPGPILEHATRRHFIDPFLSALGWDLSQLNKEMIEEARIRGETTLRLDYLGVNQQTRFPILIVEAKPWAAPFVAPSAKRRIGEGAGNNLPIDLICAAIEHCKAGGHVDESPVTLEWAGYIAKLHQYVTTIKNESGHIVTRVSTLSGQWLVTFNDPEAIFIAPTKVNPLLISVYRGSELITQAETIFDEIAHCSLTDAFPELIRPSLVPAYIKTADIKQTYRALWISRQTTGASWKPLPNIHFEVAIVIERRDGALLTVINQTLQGFSMPHDYRELKTHISDINAQSDKLLSQVNLELNATLQPSKVDSFPGFNRHGINRDKYIIPHANQPRTILIKLVSGPGEFLLVTGTDRHLFNDTPSVNPCDCHDWVFCQAQVQEQGLHPIIVRSVDPKSFFTTREEHHCAHRLVHDRRYPRCQIDAFEEYLCCRTCVYETFCWQTAELSNLPCGTSLRVVPRQPVDFV